MIKIYSRTNEIKIPLLYISKQIINFNYNHFFVHLSLTFILLIMHIKNKIKNINLLKNIIL